MKAWEIVTGCERLTPGCDNCPTYWDYKEKGMDYHPIFHMDRLRDPYEMVGPATVVVAPGSDLLHEAITYKHILAAAAVMEENHDLVFELGTKRAERLGALQFMWPDNVMVGIPVEESKYKWRIDILRDDVQAKHKMISFGPMTGRVGKVDLSGIEAAGVVVETWGPNPRYVPQSWVDEVKDQCLEQGVRYIEQHWVSEEII